LFIICIGALLWREFGFTYSSKIYSRYPRIKHLCHSHVILFIHSFTYWLNKYLFPTIYMLSTIPLVNAWCIKKLSLTKVKHMMKYRFKRSFGELYSEPCFGHPLSPENSKALACTLCHILCPFNFMLSFYTGIFSIHSNVFSYLIYIIYIFSWAKFDLKKGRFLSFYKINAYYWFVETLNTTHFHAPFFFSVAWSDLTFSQSSTTHT
jgi:hypothetical protein